MKNDFDFIKEQIDNSGVNAPESMDEGYVLERIAETQPNPLPEPSLTLVKPKRNWKKIATVAACFVLVAAIGGGITAGVLGKKAVPPVKQSIGLVQFENYDQVRTALKEIDSRNRKYSDTKTVSDEAIALSADGAAPEANGSASGSSGSASGSKDAGYGGADSGTASHSETYKQVEGVDEPDIIKTDGKYIYVTEHSYSGDDYSMRACVAVFPAVPGTTDPIARIIPGEANAATPDEANPDEGDGFEDLDSYTYSSSSVNDLFIKDSRLVVICSDYTENSYHGMYSYESFTRAYVYDVADMDRVNLLDSFTQSGSYTSSRMIGDTLYLITNEYSATNIPICGRGATPDEIAADCIYSIEKPSQDTFLIVGAYDTLDHTAATASKAILGIADDIYCSENNLYLAATEWNYGPIMTYDYAVDEDVITYGEAATSENDEESIKTKIFKVSLTDGIAFTACGEVVGYTNNQYSFDEYNGNLRVATTSQNADYEDVNNLFVLDDSLNVIGSVTGFAPTESIKAVRYIGETAYVITYEQTDPLFIIDLSEPAAPAVLGEVKISGFSTMLVPIDESTLLGIGVNTGEYDYTSMEVQDGVKLALFDISDKSSPKVLDSRSYVNYSSAVTYNPRALVYNAERNDYLIPMNYYYFDDSDEYVWSEDDDDDAWDKWYRSHIEQFGGALNFTVMDGKLVETDLVRTESESVDRAVFVGGTIYMTCYDENGGVHLISADYR